MQGTQASATDQQGATRVACAVADGRATITLVRAAARNAIDRRFTEELEAAVDACAARTDLRVVVIVAEGDHFSVGGDLRHMAGFADELGDELGRMITPFHRALDTLARLEVPVVAGVQGAFAGGAMGIAYAADVVVAADDLRVAAGFPALGLSGDGGTSWHLPRLVGLRRAQELLVENRILDAAEALDWGLVTRTVPRAELAAEVERTAARLAAGPTRSLGRARRLLRTSSTTSIGDRLAEERESMRELGDTADAREGVRAFAEKRAPRFEGR
ncbi:unannotated protein [freshwater metagenome]|uniref:Unannotated protein n=1 Tax=freshwater metagenome TaxID=449393 RepID=A0A6J7HVF8_9ZZZZ|nr:enoyl-CoA hydratase [Actinomycetota bacterium]